MFIEWEKITRGTLRSILRTARETRADAILSKYPIDLYMTFLFTVEIIKQASILLEVRVNLRLEFKQIL